MTWSFYLTGPVAPDHSVSGLKSKGAERLAATIQWTLDAVVSNARLYPGAGMIRLSSIWSLERELSILEGGI